MTFSTEHLAESIRTKVNIDAAGCWLWTCPISKTKGYGTVRYGGKTRRAHRVVYEVLVGPIPDGLQLDHLCRVRHCVNPAHLEPVTCRENIRRGVSCNKIKTHCPKGHEYSDVNTYHFRGKRYCKQCQRGRSRALYQRAWRLKQKLKGHRLVHRHAPIVRNHKALPVGHRVVRKGTPIIRSHKGRGGR